MRKLQAVRIKSTPGGTFIEGYANRGKNRERVWVHEITNKSRPEVLAAVKASETARYLVEEIQGAIAEVNEE